MGGETTTLNPEKSVLTEEEKKEVEKKLTLTTQDKEELDAVFRTDQDEIPLSNESGEERRMTTPVVEGDTVEGDTEGGRRFRKRSKKLRKKRTSKNVRRSRRKLRRSRK